MSFRAGVVMLGLLTIPSKQQSKPIIIAPSGQWDGPDGPWSSFDLGVGVPRQNLRGLPSTTRSALQLPDTDDCRTPRTAPTNCDSPGGHFSISKSSMWSSLGTYNLQTFSGSMAGSLGTDIVFWTSDSQSKGQLVLTSRSPDLALALFGLSKADINISNVTKKSLMTALHDQGSIPSNFYSYNAGSYGRNESASLILGGYDASRMVPNISITYDASDTKNHDLTVSVSSVQIMSDAREVMPYSSGSNRIQAFDAVIDSSTPQMYLPLDVCQYFERIFGLTWDEKLTYYFISETSHRDNLQDNLTVFFSLQNFGETTNFTLSYAALSLWLGYPYTVDKANISRYFPIRRKDGGEYILGRAFLQETYLLVDNERHNFSIYQAAFGGNSRVKAANTWDDPSSEIQNTTQSTPPDGPGTKQKERRLSIGAYAGIGVGSVGALVLGVLMMFLWRRHQNTSRMRADQERFEKAELNGETKDREEVMGASLKELETVEHKHEFSGSQLDRWELQGSEVPVHELGPADGQRTERR